jgi:hypothetical protein
MTTWAQDLKADWRGVETTVPRPGYWPAVLTLRAGGFRDQDAYGEDGSDPAFRPGCSESCAAPGSGKVRVNEMKILEQRDARDGGWSPGRDYSLHLTQPGKSADGRGRTYKPVGTCNRGSFETIPMKAEIGGHRGEPRC